MRLDHKFHIEVRFKEFFVSAAGSDRCAYCLGEGTIGGEKLRGKMRWTNRARRRDDGARFEFGKVIQNTGTWLPHFDGVIKTDEGPEVLFSFAGLNRSIEMKNGWHRRAITGRITFSTGDSRYLWVNDLFGVAVGQGAWPMDEENYLKIVETGRYKDDEVWNLSGFACVNDLILSTSNEVKLDSSSSIPQNRTEDKPHLRQLFVGDILFEETERFPTSGGDAEWAGYSSGKGRIEGEYLEGKVTCVNTLRRRSDGTWLPHVSGKIKTSDKETILFALKGYSPPLRGMPETNHQQITGSVTFQTGAVRYKWLNHIFCLFEGEDLAEKEEHWRFRAFECINPFAKDPKEAGVIVHSA